MGRDMGDTDGASETCCQIRRAEGSVQHGRIAQPERVFGYAQIEGGAEEDQKRYGRGIMTISYFDKKKPVDKYSGEWVDDKCHGRGTKLFSCLDCFEGMFENGIRADGQGVMTFKDGRIYSGNWKAFTTVGMNDDVEHDGQGTMTFPTGDEYTGQWLHSMQDGEGTIVGAVQLLELGVVAAEVEAGVPVHREFGTSLDDGCGDGLVVGREIVRG